MAETSSLTVVVVEDNELDAQLVVAGIHEQAADAAVAAARVTASPLP